MSYPLGVTSIATGIVSTVYGSYKCMTANRKANAQEVNNQKSQGLKFLAAGVSAIAIGVGLIYSGKDEVQDEMQEQVMEECPVNRLKFILQKIGADSIPAKAFELLEKTRGISCENFLPWNSKFLGGDYIDRVRPEDLKQPVMWGIDPSNRPFISLRYVCNEVQQGAITLFERYDDFSANMVSGGHFRCTKYRDFLNHVGTVTQQILEQLAPLFRGEVVTSNFEDKTVLQLS